MWSVVDQNVIMGHMTVVLQDVTFGEKWVKSKRGRPVLFLTTACVATINLIKTSIKRKTYGRIYNPRKFSVFYMLKLNKT